MRLRLDRIGYYPEGNGNPPSARSRKKPKQVRCERIGTGPNAIRRPIKVEAVECHKETARHPGAERTIEYCGWSHWRYQGWRSPSQSAEWTYASLWSAKKDPFAASKERHKLRNRKQRRSPTPKIGLSWPQDWEQMIDLWEAMFWEPSSYDVMTDGYDSHLVATSEEVELPLRASYVRRRRNYRNLAWQRYQESRSMARRKWKHSFGSRRSRLEWRNQDDAIIDIMSGIWDIYGDQMYVH